MEEKLVLKYEEIQVGEELEAQYELTPKLVRISHGEKVMVGEAALMLIS